MGNVLKIGGKDPSSNVKAVSVDANGRVKSTRYWDSSIHTLIDSAQIRENNPVVSTATDSFDASEYGFVSLRIRNSHDAALSVMFYEDAGISGDTWMTRLDGSYISFTVPANTQRVIVTPEDVPEINYLKYLKLRVSAKTTPTEGSVTIQAITKR